MNNKDRLREARREYYRRWRAANPDKVRASEQRRWQRYAEKLEAEDRQRKEGGAKK